MICGSAWLAEIYETSGLPNSGGWSKRSDSNCAGLAAATIFTGIREFPRPLSLQPQGREAKPYQIRQFLEMVEEFGLTMEGRQ